MNPSQKSWSGSDRVAAICGNFRLWSGASPDAKPLKGFGGAGGLELIENHHGSTYRAVYTVRFARRVCVLHAFQKKSKRGVATPKREIELIRERLRWAERLWTGRATEA